MLPQGQTSSCTAAALKRSRACTIRRWHNLDETIRRGSTQDPATAPDCCLGETVALAASRVAVSGCMSRRPVAAGAPRWAPTTPTRSPAASPARLGLHEGGARCGRSLKLHRDDAEAPHGEARAKTIPTRSVSRISLGVGLLEAGRTAQDAIALLEATLRARESRLGPDHPRHAHQPQQPRRCLPFRRSLADEAIALLEATLGDAAVDSSAPTTSIRCAPAASTSPRYTAQRVGRRTRSGCMNRQSLSSNPT